MAFLTSLPLEVLSEVASRLPNRDIKNLRLTCTSLSSAVRLRFDRVYLSPHQRDIEVFKAISRHNLYRKSIVELVYDDARFPRSIRPDPEDDWDAEYERRMPPDMVPRWFEEVYDENVDILEGHISTHKICPELDALRSNLESRLSLDECWKHYMQVVEEQDKVIATSDDIRALEDGLAQFPRLSRIIITPVAHGFTFHPVYQTPMIRSLPRGFVYPIPRGWPESVSETRMGRALSWDDAKEREKWRGYRSIMNILARHQHHVTELILDVHRLRTGLSRRMFDQENQDYHEFVSLLQSPGFSHLELALFIGDRDHNGWSSYNTGLLQSALSVAKDLRHFSLTTGFLNASGYDNPEHFGDGAEEHYMPLRALFPLDVWHQIRHFGLSYFIVIQDDLLELLLALPDTLRSVELSCLCFLEGGGGYRGLLYGMRDRLGWNQRVESERPRVTIYLEIELQIPMQFIDISHETDAFLYRAGDCPFLEGHGTNIYRDQDIGVERWPLLPANDRPYTQIFELMKRNIIKVDREEIALWGFLR